MPGPFGNPLGSSSANPVLGGLPLGATPKTSSATAPYVVTYGDNSGYSTTRNQTWTCPKTGTYRFAQWGQGGFGNGSAPYGGGAAHAQTVRKIGKDETVTIAANSTSGTRGAKITLTFPDGTVVETLGGQNSSSGGAGGTATGGDINVSGSVGSGAGGNAGSYGNFTGGIGAGDGVTPQYGVTPGGGATASSYEPGSAFVIIIREA